MKAKFLLLAAVLLGCSDGQQSSQPDSREAAISGLEHGMSMAEVESLMGGPGVPVHGQTDQFTFHTGQGPVTLQFVNGHYEHIVEDQH